MTILRLNEVLCLKNGLLVVYFITVKEKFNIFRFFYPTILTVFYLPNNTDSFSLNKQY